MRLRYLWERHVTFKAFWRLLFQGDSVGDPIAAVRFLSIVCSGLVGLYLLRAVIRFRLQGGVEESTGRDRVIAATIAATPLLMPFYFDYDQLLLAVPAVLLAADMLRQRDPLLAKIDLWLLRIWPAHFVWLMVNPDIALLTRRESDGAAAGGRGSVADRARDASWRCDGGDAGGCPRSAIGNGVDPPVAIAAG